MFFKRETKSKVLIYFLRRYSPSGQPILFNIKNVLTEANGVMTPEIRKVVSTLDEDGKG